jgi:hypothetical protein
MPQGNAIAPRNSAPRTERLRVAIIWSELFIREANREIDGKRNTVPRAVAQLRAALDTIDDNEEARCECTHTMFNHDGLTGGICLMSGCLCLMYKEKM